MKTQLTKEQKSKMTFKEKYGKCNSKNKRSNFNMFKNGFLNSNPSEIPQGFNFALGYTTETIEMIYKNDKRVRAIEEVSILNLK